MNRPWMPLYIGDYLADTAHLRAAESGAYMLLLMHLQVNGCLPTDDSELACVARMSVREWSEVKPVISDLFERPSWWDGSTAADRALGKNRSQYRPQIPLSIRAEVIERDGFSCVYCGHTDGPFDLDHIFPWSRGGDHSVENLVVACRNCNLSKGAKTPSEWERACQ